MDEYIEGLIECQSFLKTFNDAKEMKMLKSQKLKLPMTGGVYHLLFFNSKIRRKIFYKENSKCILLFALFVTHKLGCEKNKTLSLLQILALYADLTGIK